MRSMMIGAVLLAMTTNAHAQGASPVEDFILKLPNDATRVLSLKAPAAARNARSPGESQTIVCRAMALPDAQLETSFAILSSDSNRVFPGAILVVDQNLAHGRPTVTRYSRPPLNLNISLPGLGKDARFTVADPTAGTVAAEVDRAVSAWLSGPGERGYQPRANLSYRTTRAYNQQQAAAGLGFSASWTGGRASGALSVSSDQSRATYLRLFRQVFYEVSVDRPARVDAFFGKDVTVARLQRDFGPDRLAGYVSNVTYGRLILVSMETDASTSEADAKGAIDYSTGVTGASGQASARWKSVANNARFNVIVLGGGAELAARVIGQGPNNDQQVKDIIQNGSRLSRDNPGFPIGYTVNLLTGELAHARYDGPFSVPRCEPFSNYVIELRHDGAYNGRFTVRWQEPRGDGEGSETKTWESGAQTAGWRRTITAPGDATGLVVRGEFDFFHNHWRQAGFWNDLGRERSCLRIFGTTVQPEAGRCA